MRLLEPKNKLHKEQNMIELEEASKKINQASDLIKQAESQSDNPVLPIIKEKLWKVSDMLEKIAQPIDNHK